MVAVMAPFLSLLTRKEADFFRHFIGTFRQGTGHKGKQFYIQLIFISIRLLDHC